MAEGLVFPDEVLVWGPWLRAFVPLTPSSFLPETRLIYPSLFTSLAGLALAMANAMGLVSVASHLDVVLVGRVVSATAGVATVALTGLLGARFYSRRVGLGAAALVAVAPMDVMQAHLVSSDVLLGTCAALALYGACACVARGTVPAAALAGATAGLCFTAKYPGIALAGAPAWAVAEVAWRRRSLRLLVWLALAAALGFLAASFVGCPQCWLRPDLMLDAMRVHWGRDAQAWTQPNNHLAPTLGWYGRPYLYQLVASLPFALGWPLWLAACAGAGVALVRRTASDRVILAGTLVYLAGIGASHVTFPRYLIPLFPGLLVLASRALLAPALPRGANLARAGGFVVVWVYAAWLSATQVARFSYDQQHAVARWAREVTAAAEGTASAAGGAPRVAYPGEWPNYLRLAAAFERAGVPLVSVKHGEWFAGRPELLVVPDWTATQIRRDRPASPAAAELARLESGEAGYRPVARWRSTYLQSELYSRLDPAYAGELWQGEIGFVAWAREDFVLPDVPTPGAPSADGASSPAASAPPR